MELQKRNEIICKFFQTYCLDVLKGKGEDSSGGSNDANKNFKEAIINDKVDDVDVWFIFYSKHYNRMKNFVSKRIKLKESIIETIVDLVNYPLILLTILIEKGIINEDDLNEK